MFRIFEIIIVALCLFVIKVSIQNRKLPKGILEWLYIINTILILIKWIFVDWR